MSRSRTSSDSLPVVGLLTLAAAGFLTILTEALPAGLLPGISADLGISESMAGQLITAYAAGSLAAAIPLTAATRSWRRRPLLLTAIGGFLFANAVTALSHSYVLTLGARFVAGVFAGLVWALLAGYASRMAPERLKGRAIALAMVGTPLALSIGIPAGTMVSGLIGWRAVFLMMSGLSILLIAWIAWRVPDFDGEGADGSLASGSTGVSRLWPWPALACSSSRPLCWRRSERPLDRSWRRSSSGGWRLAAQLHSSRPRRRAWPEKIRIWPSQ